MGDRRRPRFMVGVLGGGGSWGWEQGGGGPPAADLWGLILLLPATP